MSPTLSQQQQNRKNESASPLKTLTRRSYRCPRFIHRFAVSSRTEGDVFFLMKLSFIHVDAQFFSFLQRR